MTEENPEEVTPQEETQEEEKPKENPLFASLFEAAEEPAETEQEEEIPMPSSLGEALHDIEMSAEEPQEEVQEEEAQEPQEEQAESGEPPEAARPQKKKAKKIKQVVDPEVPEQKQEAPQQEQKIAFAEESEDEKIVKELIPEEKEYYDMAKFASENLNGYEGVEKKFLDYFKKSKAYVEKRLKEDPYVELADDFEYKEFVEKNRPNFTQADAKKIERAMITKHAEEAAEARVRPEVERLRREQEIARKKPEVDKKKAEYRQHFHKILPDDAQQIIEKEGVDALEKADPLGYKVMNEIYTNLLRFSDTFQDITSGLIDYDESNTVHKELLDWVKMEQDNYINTGDTKKEGKTFMRRERYWATPEDKRSEYFTWSDDDLMSLLVFRAKQRMDQTLTYQREMLAKSGYVRQGAQAAQAVQPKPAPVSTPPSPPVSPAPRGGGQQVTQSKATTPLSILGM